MGAPLSVLLVDDEPPARRLLRAHLARHPDVEVVGEAGSGTEAVAALQALRPDLVFLDVQMPEGDGFEVVRAVGVEAMPVVIFATAFDDYALQAFEAHALDYLLKPYDRERLDGALDRARRRVEQARGSSADARLHALVRALDDRVGYLDRLPVRTGARIRLLDVGEVDYVEAEANYVRLHVGPRAYLMRGTLTHLEAQLDPARFLRVHRSLLVNVDRIAEVEPLFAGEYVLYLRDGTRLTSGRTYRARLQEALRLRP
jgi:two-component system, LytTR family, response regulator